MTEMFTLPWIVQTLIASALLMAAVLALRGTVRRQFGARIAYALWLLPALRMVLPALPGWRTLAIPVLHVGDGAPTVGLVDPATAAALADAPALPAGDPPQAILHVAGLGDTAAAPAWNWMAIAVAIWLAGAAVVFIWQVVRYRLFLARALRDATLLARECGIDVLMSRHVSGPMAAGILRRRILLPADMVTRYGTDERRLALKHEAAHHDRLDIPANLLALAIVALHWWNPLATIAYRAFRADQELACDATVLAGTDAADRHAYGSAILKSASAAMPAMACALSHKDQLRNRIVMMTRMPLSLPRLLLGASLAASAVGGGLLLTASGQAHVPPPAPIAATAPAGPVDPLPPVAAARSSRAATDAARATRKAALREAAHARRAAELAQVAGRRAEEAARHGAEAARLAALQARLADRQAALAMRMAPPPPPLPASYRFAPPAPPSPIADPAAFSQAIRASVRQSMASRCAAQGITMPAGADERALATCGNHLRGATLASLQRARSAMAMARGLDDESRTRALAGIDAAIARTTRDLAE